ncbi:SGNH/GDSL hydrolase family protein [Nocardioides sp. HM23]|uniref:SGNH/GDSL hydrolase family protein n=1 Tax=Nocardioides bizhenqiangii TaxID=3095076 RepID=UPI002ACA445A|nr:SGNH/GDSL hydrolase family protein [Nocardioides sp. HM23]MDZ5620034.1 SGNH/GDSL hydrolase family protein [Nocardioides sp. HM23]
MRGSLVAAARQRFALPVVAVAVAAGLTACDDEPSRPSPVAHVLGEGDQYVALGDSYTAAVNTGPVATTDGCANSTVNYPHRIADATGMDLVDNSCGGATTDALTLPQPLGPDREHPPQLDDVDEDTDLVTIRLGANDDDMYLRIIQCAQFFGAEASGTPCADADAAKGEDALPLALADLEDSLVDGLEEIEARGPNARIIVIGYPHVIPEEGTCELLPLPADDYAYARRIIDGLNTALESAADEAGVTFIDMYAVSEGHDICGAEPWVAGAAIAPPGATAWHPYAAESQAVAELVLDELEEE